MLQTVVQAAQETSEVVGGISPVALGGLAFVGFLCALGVTYAFRNVGNRH
ncbi:hypothetical protein [Puerhibacterium puerhi]|nr:hypothetical protein [Puerhibacterium puerhi]